MDQCLWALNHGLTPAETANRTGLSDEQVARVFADIQAKRTTTHYQHERPLLIEKVLEIDV
jgi:NAD+ synthase